MVERFILPTVYTNGMNKTTKNMLPKMIASQILMEYGVRLDSQVLKMLVEERMRYEIPEQRWNEIVEEISQVSGMVMV